jgi:hypothetical protein
VDAIATASITGSVREKSPVISTLAKEVSGGAGRGGEHRAHRDDRVEGGLPGGGAEQVADDVVVARRACLESCLLVHPGSGEAHSQAVPQGCWNVQLAKPDRGADLRSPPRYAPRSGRSRPPGGAGEPRRSGTLVCVYIFRTLAAVPLTDGDRAAGTAPLLEAALVLLLGAVEG